MSNNKNLTDEQKSVLFKENTEPPGSSKLNNEKREGSYHCVNCGVKLFDSHPSYFKADTIEELAKKCGMVPEKLENSIKKYNLAVDKEEVDPFGRESLPRPINRSPFLAIRAVGFTVLSPGGLDVDINLNVLDSSGVPIPNLYAAGEIYGKSRLSGATYLSGMSLLPALTFGRLLGQKLLQWGGNLKAAE